MVAKRKSRHSLGLIAISLFVVGASITAYGMYSAPDAARPMLLLIGIGIVVVSLILGAIAYPWALIPF
jgi:hypothetical protein